MKKLILILVLLNGYCCADLINKGLAEHGKGNYKKAVEFFKQACDFKLQDGCENHKILNK